MIDPKAYCKDCKRSVYGEYKDCDINIENDGLYVRGDSECGCKVPIEKPERSERDGKICHTL